MLFGAIWPTSRTRQKASQLRSRVLRSARNLNRSDFHLLPLLSHSGLITDTMADLDRYTENFRSNIGPHIQELQDNMKVELRSILDKLQADLKMIKDKYVQYKNEAGVMINHNVDTVQSQMNLLCRKMKKRISKDVTELQNKMAEYASEVRARMDERVEAVRQSLEPYLSSFQNKRQQHYQLHGQFREKAEEVQSSLSQVAESTRQWLSLPFLSSFQSGNCATVQKYT
uniref:Uncharacterized protein n=1 Tax=Varanus komodoensis TaxID=61221 RepID=A0A8D2Q3V6_VARKO